MKTKTVKAGLIQFDVKLGDVDSNLRTALDNIRLLADRDVRMAVLPEMWSCGFDNLRLASHAKDTPHILEILSMTASRYKMIIAGSMPEASGNSIFNTLYLIDSNGSLAGSYRKIHLFRLTEEHNYYGAGSQNVVCETSAGNIGLMICYDLRFPELCRALTLKGASMVIVSAQWPIVRIPHWDILVQARAIENQIFVLAVNRCGADSNLKYGGHSQIVSPSGNVRVKAENQACTLESEIDFQELVEFREKIPCLTDRMPESY